MFEFSKHQRIKILLRLLIFLFLISVVLIAVFSYKTIQYTKVSGPVYKNIIQKEHLIADVLPSPEYIIEIYLLCHHLKHENNIQDIEKMIKEINVLRATYLMHYNIWEENLEEGNLKRLYMESASHAFSFFKIMDEEFIPLISKLDAEGMEKLVNGKLKQEFLKHRKAIDEIVIHANESTIQSEKYSAFYMQKRIVVFFILSGIILFSVILLAYYIAESIRQIYSRLQQSEEKHRRLFETMTQGVLYQNNKGEIISANPAAENILGLSLEQMQGRTSHDQGWKSIHEDGTEYHGNKYPSMKALSTGKKIKDEVMGVFNPVENDYKWININAVPELINKGKLTNSVYVTFEDITKRKKAEFKLRDSEIKFRTIFNNSSHMLFITNFRGKLIEVNDTACKTLGYSKNELLTLEPSSISAGYNLNPIERRIEEMEQSDRLLFGTALIPKSGKTIPIESTSKIINFNSIKAILTIVTDITERKQMQANLLKTILDTEEKERKRFAKDLHDGLGALLSSIGIYIELLEQNEMSTSERSSMVGNARSLIDQALISTKEIANNLQPNILRHFGLITSIQSFCDNINNTGTVKVHFDASNMNCKLKNTTEVTLYRIISELINNSLKYAFASNIDIILSNNKKTLELLYRDDGVGFDSEKVLNERKGSGLSNIISRTDSLSGKCHIRSELGKGMQTSVIVDI